MTTWVNGKAGSTTSVLDRGLNYGDGLFETMRLVDGAVRHLDRHLERLLAGCRSLGMPAIDERPLRREIDTIARAQADGALKLVVTRGVGQRGYRAAGAELPVRILSWSPVRPADEAASKAGVRLRVCVTRASENAALAGLKHLNRLDNVLARSEWSDPEVAEGLMLDSRDRVVGGTMSNVFAVRSQILRTPRIERAGVRGVMRTLVVDAARDLGIAIEECELSTADIAAADEIFLTNAIIGLWPVRQFELRALPVGPVTLRLQDKLRP